MLKLEKAKKKLKMREKIKRGIKKAVLGSLILLYGFKANRHTKQSLKYREEEKGYRKVLKDVTRDKSGAELKSDFQRLKSAYKKLGKQLILDYFIAINYAKANRHEKKSVEYGKKKQEYKSRLEEISKHQNTENTGENKLESITKEDSNNPSPETSANKSYYDSMKEFYQKYEAANDTLTSTIGKILSGDYIENGERVWYWKDRVRKVREYLGNNQLPEPVQKQIFEILKKDRYFMSKKLNELSELNNTLFRETRINNEIREYLSNRTRQ